MILKIALDNLPLLVFFAMHRKSSMFSMTNEQSCLYRVTCHKFTANSLPSLFVWALTLATFDVHALFLRNFSSQYVNLTLTVLCLKWLTWNAFESLVHKCLMASISLTFKLNYIPTICFDLCNYNSSLWHACTIKTILVWSVIIAYCLRLCTKHEPILIGFK